MKPVILEAAGDGALPPLRWRTFRDREEIPNGAFGVAFGLMYFGGPEWGLCVYLGRWLIGIERTREED